MLFLAGCVLGLIAGVLLSVAGLTVLVVKGAKALNVETK